MISDQTWSRRDSGMSLVFLDSLLECFVPSPATAVETPAAALWPPRSRVKPVRSEVSGEESKPGAWPIC